MCQEKSVDDGHLHQGCGKLIVIVGQRPKCIHCRSGNPLTGQCRGDQSRRGAISFGKDNIKPDCGGPRFVQALKHPRDVLPRPGPLTFAPQRFLVDVDDDYRR